MSGRGRSSSLASQPSPPAAQASASAAAIAKRGVAAARAGSVRTGCRGLPDGAAQTLGDRLVEDLLPEDLQSFVLPAQGVDLGREVAPGEQLQRDRGMRLGVQPPVDVILDVVVAQHATSPSAPPAPEG